MSKHDCPDCRCDERGECTDGHCLHDDGAYLRFCCRCSWREAQVFTTGNSNAWPRPGCQLALMAIY